ncbi:MAG: GNAT family N-acetyltransferase [Pseudomonadota bacterium]
MTPTVPIRVDVPVLETERLIFGAPGIEHLEDEVAFFASERSAGVGGPLPRDQVFRSLAGIIGHWVIRGYGFWAITEKSSGRYCGRVGCWFPEGWPEREIGWSLMEHAEGRGLAAEAAIASRKFAYDHMGWQTAISLVLPGNTRSIALAERLGCTLDDDYEHPKHGVVLIFRHPPPEAVR